MGLEPTTFCMASRRSSQLSYIRQPQQVSRIPARPLEGAKAQVRFRSGLGFPLARSRAKAGAHEAVVEAYLAGQIDHEEYMRLAG